MKVKPDAESEDLRGMREAIERMEWELKGMDKDIEEAKKIRDPGMREVALRNFEQLRQNTREMIANLKETYQTMKGSEAKARQLSGKGA